MMDLQKKKNISVGVLKKMYLWAYKKTYHMCMYACVFAQKKEKNI